MPAALDTLTPVGHTVLVDHSINQTDIGCAVLKTLAYADVFDYPLTGEQLHRYLIGMQVSLDYLHAVLMDGCLTASGVSRLSGFYTLVGRESIVETHKQRAEYSARLWIKARFYGNLIARLPFVRMVAVTGALAMNNASPGREITGAGPRKVMTGAQPGDDIDYLIVTLPGRLWLCRAIVIAQVRLAALRGDTICPNYFLSERATIFPQRTLYTAHELVQMVPLSGLEVYKRIRARNKWAQAFLPNAEGQPRGIQSNDNAPDHPRLFSFAEAPAFSPVASRLENWEMARKVRRFQNRTREGEEVSFCADWCKGHFDGHGMKTMSAFMERLQALGIADTEPRLWSDR